MDATGLSALGERADDPELGYLVYRMIGACHSASEKPAEAADAYQKSVELSEDFDDKVTSATLRAGMLEKIGASDQALQEISQLLDGVGDGGDAKERLWSSLAGIYDALGEPQLHAASLHRVAQLAGNDAGKWFRAGYAYAETDDASLGILVVHCYVTCLNFDSDHQYARNNLGALASERKMPLLATEYYEEAAELGNTLAMGNMAQNYLNAGFGDDAAKMVERAEKRPSQHEKVATVKAGIASRRSEELEKLRDLTSAGSRAGQFLTTYVAARMKQAPDLPGDWEVDKHDVVVEISGDTVVATWSEGSYRGDRRFEGTRSGASISGTFEAEGASLITSSEPSWKNDGSGFGIVSADSKTIQFLKLTDEKATYLEFLAPDGQDA